MRDTLKILAISDLHWYTDTELAKIKKKAWITVFLTGVVSLGGMR